MSRPTVFSLLHGELIRPIACLGLGFTMTTRGAIPRVCPMPSSEILPGANRHGRPPWARFIFALDSWLRRRQGVFEYSDKLDCIFRAQLSRLSGDLLLSDGTCGRSGDRVIDLHFWNEQIPVTSVAGNSLAWGCRFNRSFAKSLLGLAQFLKSKPELSDINIIRANINLDPLRRIVTRHGFEASPAPAEPPPWERVRRFGEDILCWLLTLACKSGRSLPNAFWRCRQPMYLSRRVLDCKHISPYESGPNSGPR